MLFIGGMRPGSSKPLSIAIVDVNPIRASIIEAGLREAGHESVHVIDAHEGVGRALQNLLPDVVIIDLENPERDRIEHFLALSRTLKKPVAMFVDRSDAQSMEAAIEAGVSAYVVDGLRKDRVAPIMELAISRFFAFNRLESELEKARNALEERKTIDAAKRLMMRSRGIGEEEAYRLMRSAAMNSNCRIHDIAKSLLSASDLLGAQSTKEPS